MTRYVVLVHGFLRRGRNMRYLARELEQRGYRAITPTLPTVFRGIRACGEALARTLETRIPKGSVAHFVGHSMGGLVIRDYLSRQAVEGLGKVVLIGTPNGGSRYANWLLELPFSQEVFESLPDLAEPGPDIAPPLNVPPPDIGIIAGTRPDPVRNILLPGEHDGLVAVESVRRIAASDEMLIPCAHEWLHWRLDTAEAVASFLETGKFHG
ncbi:MAG: alpha/beta fold hydrolase [Synergistaceae bacterium]|nr:alpha/beta fold hydrolase [Synergistaceae bacterium]